MVHSHTIETYSAALHKKNIWQTGRRHAWPILLSAFQAAFIPLLTISHNIIIRCLCNVLIFNLCMFQLLILQRNGLRYISSTDGWFSECLPALRQSVVNWFRPIGPTVDAKMLCKC